MSPSRRVLTSRPLAALAIALCVFLALVALRRAGAVQPLELALYDQLVRLRAGAGSVESPVVLVRIHEEDIRRFGYPLCDALLARALERLLEGRPRVVGLDLYRDTPVSDCGQTAQTPGEGGDSRLRAVVTGTDRIVMIEKLAGEAGEATPPPRWLVGTDQVGFSDIPVDPGGIARRGLLFLWTQDAAHLSLSLRTALRYLADDGIFLEPDPADPNRIRLGTRTVPPFRADDGPYEDADDGGYQVLLDFRGGPREVASLPLARVLSGAPLADRVADRIVLLGVTADSVKDYFYTPSGRPFGGGEKMYGVELQARAAGQLVRLARGTSGTLESPGGAAEGGWILLWSLLGAALAYWSRSWLAAGLGVVALSALFGAAYLCFLRDWWLPAAGPALATVGSAGLVTAYTAVAERAERRAVTQLFSRFLRPQVAAEIWRQRDQFMRGDEPARPRSRWVHLSVLMADLEGYTSASEQMDPYVLMDWANEFLAAMAEIIEAHGGIVDDYAGDGIKVNFGFPVPSVEEPEIDADAVSAVRCALAMGEEMERLNERWSARGLPTGRVRIGIYTGPAVVGVLGGERSLKYTSVGNTVNAASRLESFDKDGFGADSDGPCWRVLIGDETHRRLGGHFETRDLGLHPLKGKAEPVRIHRVLGAARARRAAHGR